LFKVALNTITRILMSDFKACVILVYMFLTISTYMYCPTMKK
jgi:hypothetical protein